MEPTYSPSPTAEQLAAFMATHPPIAGGDDGPAGAATAEAGTGEGQGEGAGSENGLYPDLSSLTPDQRTLVEPHLKAMEGNVTRKFKEHADHRSQWEPYEQLGVHETEPEVVDFLLNFYDEMQDPDKFKTWVQEQADSLGVAPNGDGGENTDLDTDDNDPSDPEQMRAMMRELLQEEVGPLKQQAAEEQASKVQAEESAALTSRLDELATEAKLELDDEAREDVYTLAMRYPAEEKDPIGLAFERYQQITGNAESALLEGKRGEPDPPAGPGGGAASGQEPIKTFGQAEEMARRRLRESQAA